jgi:hypothetical protein
MNRHDRERSHILISPRVSAFSGSSIKGLA